MVPDLPDTQAIFTLGPLPARVLAGVGGLVLLLAGSRAYRVAVVVLGMLVGLAVALPVGAALGLEPAPLALVCGVASLLGGLATHLAEKLTVVIAGMLGGVGAAQVAWPMFATGAPPWWLWPVAALAGALTFPLLWRVALAPLTAWLGAVVLVDAAGLGAHPLLVPGLAVVGTLVQWRGGGGKRAKRRGGEDEG